MKDIRYILLLACVCLGLQGASAELINLAPGQSLQQAIDAASNGDTILLEEGIYKGDIDYKGKSITIQGQGKRSIIKGTGYRSVVSFTQGEGSDSVLDRVRVTGGLRGGGILVSESSPTIRRCWIMKNKALGSGSGVFIFGNDKDGNSASFLNNVFAFNKTRAVKLKGLINNKSHAIYIQDSSPKFINNTLIRNDYSAFHITGDSSPSLMNNIVAFNKRFIERFTRDEMLLNGLVFSIVRFYRRTHGMGISFGNLKAGANPVVEHNLFFNNAKGDVMIEGQTFDSFNDFASSSAVSGISLGANISDINPRFVNLSRLNLALEDSSIAKAGGGVSSDGSQTSVDIGATGGSFPISDF